MARRTQRIDEREIDFLIGSSQEVIDTNHQVIHLVAKDIDDPFSPAMVRRLFHLDTCRYMNMQTLRYGEGV